MDQATSHIQKQCPRCGKVFECKAGNISACQCSGIQLPEPIIIFIKAHYTDCLCIACLEDLSKKSVEK